MSAAKLGWRKGSTTSRTTAPTRSSDTATRIHSQGRRGLSTPRWPDAGAVVRCPDSGVMTSPDLHVVRARGGRPSVLMEHLPPQRLALTTRCGATLELLRGGRQVVDLADETRQVG